MILIANVQYLRVWLCGATDDNIAKTKVSSFLKARDLFYNGADMER